jgi:hypothetical protein
MIILKGSLDMRKRINYCLRWITFLAVLIYFVFIRSEYEIKDVLVALLLLTIISIGLWFDYKEYNREKL